MSGEPEVRAGGVPAEQRVNLTPEAVSRFWSYVDKTPTCWLWTQVPNDQGYGNLSIDNTKVGGHRLAYHLLRGPIPVGMELDHICRVRHCVNPDHLEPVTHKENGLRGISPQAINARKTHCVRNHEFTPENTYLTTSGGRRCRTCRREYDRRRGNVRKGVNRRGQAA